MLPTDADARKAIPIYSGFVKYFPHAMAAVAELSRIGNDQHNPGQPLHWAKEKSKDELDALMRHTVDFAIDADHRDPDGVHPAVKRAWRAMADLERLHDAGVNIFAVDPVNAMMSFSEGGIGRVHIGVDVGAEPATSVALRQKIVECEGDQEPIFEFVDPKLPADPDDVLLYATDFKEFGECGPWDAVFTVMKEGGGIESEQRRGPYETIEQAQDYARRNPERLPGTIHIAMSRKEVREDVT